MSATTPSRFVSSGRFRAAAAVLAAAVALTAALFASGTAPIASGSGGGVVTLPPSDLRSCTHGDPIIVASDVNSQEDLYAAGALALAVNSNCVVLAGTRGSSSMDVAEYNKVLNSTATAVWIIGAEAVVGDSKAAGKSYTRINPAGFWGNSQAVMHTVLAGTHTAVIPGTTARPELEAEYNETQDVVTLSMTAESHTNEEITTWVYRYSVADTHTDWLTVPKSAEAESFGHTIKRMRLQQGMALIGGETWTFQVATKTALGQSLPSNAATVVIAKGTGTPPPATTTTAPPTTTAAPDTKPAKPTLSASNGDGAITITASVSDDGGSAVTGWRYRTKTTGSYGSWTDIASSAGNSVTHTISGLTNNTAYTIQVAAVNSVGQSDSSDEAASTPAPLFQNQTLRIMHVIGLSEACLDVSGGVHNNGQNVQTWTCNSTNAQKWKLEQRSAGTHQGKYRLVSQIASKDYCLDSRGDNHNGGRVHIWFCVGDTHWSARNQSLNVTENSDGTFQLTFANGNQTAINSTSQRTSSNPKGNVDATTSKTNNTRTHWTIEATTSASNDAYHCHSSVPLIVLFKYCHTHDWSQHGGTIPSHPDNDSQTVFPGH